jgi:hypothetical protein
MGPAGEKAAFGRRGPAFDTENSGNIDSLAAEMSDQRVSRGVIADCRNGQDASTERGEIVCGVGAATRNNLSFAMFEDQDRCFARDTGDFAVLKLVGHEIAQKNNRFRMELLDALAEGEQIDGR